MTTLLSRVFFAISILGCAEVSSAKKHKENQAPPMQTYTALTDALPLLPGEVTNTFHKIPIPSGPIAVYEFAADIVEKDSDGNISPTPLSDAYLHHHVVGSNHKEYESQQNHSTPMKPRGMFRSVGFGAGTESRGTLQKFPFPYAFTTVDGEDEWIANVHVINTRDMTPEASHHCLECPCTSEDVKANGTVNETPREWDSCNDVLALQEENTACRAETYIGGLRCCEHGEHCLEMDDLADALTTTKTSSESQLSTFYLRYTLTYAPIVPENKILGLAGCCDATGDMDRRGNVEYDIPKCDLLESPDCTHTVTTVQRLHGTSSGAFGITDGGDGDEEKVVDIVYMVGHMHRGGIELALHDETSGELICKSVPSYGKGEGIGNEEGYIVSMSTCTFDPPRRMSTMDPVRVTAKYDANEAHTGVMSLFYIATHDVEDGIVEGAKYGLAAASPRKGRHKFRSFLKFVVFASIGTVAFVILRKKYFMKKNEGYRQVQGAGTEGEDDPYDRLTSTY